MKCHEQATTVGTQYVVMSKAGYSSSGWRMFSCGFPSSRTVRWPHLCVLSFLLCCDLFVWEGGLCICLLEWDILTMWIVFNKFKMHSRQTFHSRLFFFLFFSNVEPWSQAFANGLMVQYLLVISEFSKLWEAFLKPTYPAFVPDTRFGGLAQDLQWSVYSFCLHVFPQMSAMCPVDQFLLLFACGYNMQTSRGATYTSLPTAGSRCIPCSRQLCTAYRGQSRSLGVHAGIAWQNVLERQ